jgi:peptidoglycan/xylan/chitin deacetylase (PgdA/CDA1 family)
VSCRLPTILLYHHVVPETRSDTLLEPTTVALSAFAEQLDALAADGWQFVTLEDMLARLCADDQAPPDDAFPELAVTFDDGYASLLDAWPVLARRRIPATVFVLTELLGQSNLWNAKAFSVERHLSLDELAALAAEGLGLEFHGTDHQRLTKLASDEVERRFARGQDFFARHLGRPARAIAYPYGAFNAEVLALVQRYFAFGLAVDRGEWAGRAVRHRLNRVEVQDFMTPDVLVRLLALDKRLRPRFLQETRARLRLERLPP